MPDQHQKKDRLGARTAPALSSRPGASRGSRPPTSTSRKGTQASRGFPGRGAPPLRHRRHALILSLMAGTVAFGTAVVVGVSLRGGSPSPRVGVDHARATLSGPNGPEGVPLETGIVLAPQSSAATGGTVQGIRCDASEQVALHIHAHLAVFVDGTLRPVPAGIGVVTPVAQQTADGPFDAATHCYYWIHVHAQDGVIHIESPTRRTYTLGQFFAIWRQPLDRSHVGPAVGRLAVFVNGWKYGGNPASIELDAHEDIQIDVGTPTVTPKRIDWTATGL
jgi:hypothetical protein